MTIAETKINPRNARTRRSSEDPVVQAADPGRPAAPAALLMPAPPAEEVFVATLERRYRLSARFWGGLNE